MSDERNPPAPEENWVCARCGHDEFNPGEYTVENGQAWFCTWCGLDPNQATRERDDEQQTGGDDAVPEVRD